MGVECNLDLLPITGDMRNLRIGYYQTSTLISGKIDLTGQRLYIGGYIRKNSVKILNYQV